MQIAELTVIAVYKHLSTHRTENIEYRFDLKNERAKTPQGSILVIGGDRKAHIDRGAQLEKTWRTFVLDNPTKEAGHQLLDWCESLEMQWVNSFSNQNRGTWLRTSSRRWYEIDGFRIRRKQRHKFVTKLSTTEEVSDHRPITIWLRVPSKNKREARCQRLPSIMWQKLRDEKNGIAF